MKTKTNFDLGGGGTAQVLEGPLLRLAPDPAARGSEPELHRVVTRYERYAKPVVDRILAGLLLLVALPVMAVVSVAVATALGSPILLRQERVGLDGQPFAMLKFRTMHHCRRSKQRPIDGPDRRQRHKCDDDPRHTPLGRFLRAWSLDELPQLFNVLRGEMSLVGPRPELVSVVERHYEPWQHHRHVVKPGVTGLWQVTERGGNGSEMHKHTAVDLRYVSQVTFRDDAKILLLTVPALLGAQRGS